MIREIPGTNLETGRYGPKSGVCDDYTAQYWSFNLDYKICQSVGSFKNYTIPLRTEKICLFMRLRLVTSYVMQLFLLEEHDNFTVNSEFQKTSSYSGFP